MTGKQWNVHLNGVYGIKGVWGCLFLLLRYRKAWIDSIREHVGGIMKYETCNAT